MVFPSEWALHQFKKKKKTSHVYGLFQGADSDRFWRMSTWGASNLFCHLPWLLIFTGMWLWGCDAFRVTMGLGRWANWKATNLTALSKVQTFFIKLTFLRLLPDIDFQNSEKVTFFLAFLWLLWRSWFSEVLTLPFWQCFCCIFRKWTRVDRKP